VNEEPPCSDNSIFAKRGKTVGSSKNYNSTAKERKFALLYMYANIYRWDGQIFSVSVFCTSFIITKILSCWYILY
jgi:hypothetical protein